MPKYKVKTKHQCNGKLWNVGEEAEFDAPPCQHWEEIDPPSRSPELDKWQPPPSVEEKPFNPPKRKPGRPKKK